MTKRTLAYSHWEADSRRFDSTPQFFFFGVQYRLVEGSIWPKMGKAYADSQCQNNKKKQEFLACFCRARLNSRILLKLHNWTTLNKFINVCFTKKTIIQFKIQNACSRWHVPDPGPLLFWQNENGIHDRILCWDGQRWYLWRIHCFEVSTYLLFLVSITYSCTCSWALWCGYRYGARGRELVHSVGKVMLQGGGTFGTFMAIGTGVRC